MASQNTIRQVMAIIKRHVSNPRTLMAILADLKEVPGNKSFRDTIEGLEREFLRTLDQKRLVVEEQETTAR